MDKSYQSPSIKVLGTLSDLTLTHTKKKFGEPNDGVYLVIGEEEFSLTKHS
jgi:hypothetical protein